MSNAPTSPTGRDAFGMSAEDRRRLQSRTDAETAAAAAADPDAQPIPPDRLTRMGRPLAKVVRHKLRMSREEFAAAYDIPLDVLVKWERQEAEPSHAECAYLRLIEREPDLARLVRA